MVEHQNLFRANPSVHGGLRPSSHFRQAASKAARLASFALAGIFFWFGILKLNGVSPMIEMLRNSIPVLADYPYIQLLALIEILIGFGLLTSKLSRVGSALMMVNLVCILAIVVRAPALIFAPASPGLTPQGSFLGNYILFILAGLLISSWRQRQASDFRPTARFRRSLSRPLY